MLQLIVHVMSLEIVNYIDHLNCCSATEDVGGITSSSEVHHHLFTTPNVNAQIVCCAPVHQLFRLPPVYRLVENESIHVIWELHIMFAFVPGRPVMCEQFVQVET